MRTGRSLSFVAVSALLLLAVNSSSFGQQVDLSLHATAVPDSFEVRARSTLGSFGGLPNAVFTVRWEVSAGGVLDNSDIQAACNTYTLSNSTGTVDVLNHRYFTINLFGIRPLWQAGCPIDTSGMVLGGFRIHDLVGCRNVELAENGFTWLNNYAYYFSIAGADVTGVITSEAITAGNCPPCEPPDLTMINASPVPYCGYGVDLMATATGTALDYTWFGPDGEPLGWLPQAQAPYGTAGNYMVIVSNVCGVDTETVEAVWDPDLCTPPVIDSVGYVPWNGWGGPGIQLWATVTGSCPERTWEMPWGDVIPANPQDLVNVANPPDGVYIAVVTNDCGSDTMELVLVAPEPCTGPLLSNVAITTEDSCYTGPVQFTATVTGPGPVSTAWYDSNGQVLTGSSEFELPFAPWGQYWITVSNYCTIDTVIIFHGPSDTTGLSACEPPEILSVGPELLTCFNDTIALVASTVLNGPCAQMTWSSVDILSVNGDTSTAIFNDLAPVVLTLTNACGQVSAVVPVEAVYPQQLLEQLCRTPDALSLDSIMQLTFPFSGGDWVHVDVAHGSMYDPAVDTTGLYQYYTLVSPTAYCNVLDLYIQEFPGVYAGEDSSVVVCSTDPSFLLFDAVAAGPQPGGNWLYDGLATDPEFNPSIDPPGVYTYRLTVYQNLGFACTEEADVTVSVIPSSIWFADVDADGLGAPDESLGACAQPTGYVTNSDDDCPLLFGVVGDTCDDGNPDTANDIITESCACEGDSSTAVADRNTMEIALWPNPNSGDAFSLQLPFDAGDALVSLSDATGRALMHITVSSSLVPIFIKLPAHLGSGTYVVNIITARRTLSLRLIIAH